MQCSKGHYLMCESQTCPNFRHLAVPLVYTWIVCVCTHRQTDGAFLKSESCMFLQYIEPSMTEICVYQCMPTQCIVEIWGREVFKYQKHINWKKCMHFIIRLWSVGAVSPFYIFFYIRPSVFWQSSDLEAYFWGRHEENLNYILLFTREIIHFFYQGASKMFIERLSGPWEWHVLG